MVDLYNVVYASLGKPINTNKDGYAKTSSHELATKMVLSFGLGGFVNKRVYCKANIDWGCFQSSHWP